MDIEAFKATLTRLPQTDVQAIYKAAGDALRDWSYRAGDLVEFTSPRNGETHRIRIERVNQKTVTGKKIVAPFSTIKVSVELLRLVGADKPRVPTRPPAQAIPPANAPRVALPTAAGGGDW